MEGKPINFMVKLAFLWLLRSDVFNHSKTLYLICLLSLSMCKGRRPILFLTSVSRFASLGIERFAEELLELAFTCLEVTMLLGSFYLTLDELISIKLWPFKLFTFFNSLLLFIDFECFSTFSCLDFRCTSLLRTLLLFLSTLRLIFSIGSFWRDSFGFPSDMHWLSTCSLLAFTLSAKFRILLGCLGSS